MRRNLQQPALFAVKPQLMSVTIGPACRTGFLTCCGLAGVRLSMVGFCSVVPRLRSNEYTVSYHTSDVCVCVFVYACVCVCQFVSVSFWCSAQRARD